MTDKMIEKLVTAALYDFGGWLTSRQQEMTVSETNDAAPMAEALAEFCGMRGLSSTEEIPVLTWQDAILRAPAKEAVTPAASWKCATCPHGCTEQCAYSTPPGSQQGSHGATAPAAHTDNEGDPLDTPLPCEITIGATTFGKGVKLRALVTRARRDYELIRATMTPKDIAQAATFAEKYGSARKPDDLEAMRRDADLWQWAISHDSNAEDLYGIVMSNCGDPSEITRQAAALAAEKREG